MLEVYLFFAVIFVVAVFYGIVFAGELSDFEKEKKILRRPISFLGVICWLVLMGIAYWMLRMMDKNVWFTYAGFIELSVVMFLTFCVTDYLRNRKI